VIRGRGWGPPTTGAVWVEAEKRWDKGGSRIMREAAERASGFLLTPSSHRDPRGCKREGSKRKAGGGWRWPRAAFVLIQAEKEVVGNNVSFQRTQDRDPRGGH